MKKYMIISIALLAILLPIVSASIFSDTWDKITGKATSGDVELAINVTGGLAPVVTVYDNTITDVSGGLNEGPLSTTVTFIFQAFDSEGEGNLDDGTARTVFTKSGETDRSASCSRIATSGLVANFSCTVTMSFWDAPGTWRINANIVDLNGNYAENNLITFIVGATAGFTLSPVSVNWAEINPGATNEIAINSVVLNNTGNIDRNIEINSTDLTGETDNTKRLFANDFAVDINQGCAGTLMTYHAFQGVAGSSLPRGNYQLNDLTTAQEELFFCIKKANADLTEQSYNTQQEGSWTVKIA